jgi:hypothetical protein
MSLQKTRQTWQYLAVVLGAFLLVAISWTVGRRYVDQLVKDRTQPWAVFRVPVNPTVLNGFDVKLADDTVSLCNHTKSDWDDIFVQIDQGYLASLDRLPAGECRAIRVQDFATESWKRMPPPRDLYVSRVAITTHIPQAGYVEKLLKDEQRVTPTANEYGDHDT